MSFWKSEGVDESSCFYLNSSSVVVIVVVVCLVIMLFFISAILRIDTSSFIQTSPKSLHQFQLEATCWFESSCVFSQLA